MSLDIGFFKKRSSIIPLNCKYVPTLFISWLDIVQSIDLLDEATRVLITDTFQKSIYVKQNKKYSENKSRNEPLQQ